MFDAFAALRAIRSPAGDGFDVYTRHVFALLVSHADGAEADQPGMTFVSLDTLAAEASCSRRQVQRALHTLREAGWVTERARPGLRVERTITAPQPTRREPVRSTRRPPREGAPISHPVSVGHGAPDCHQVPDGHPAPDSRPGGVQRSPGGAPIGHPTNPGYQPKDQPTSPPLAGAREVEPEPESPTSALGAAILAELRRWAALAPIATPEEAEALSLIAFDRMRSPEAAARCVAEAGGKAGVRAARSGPETPAALGEWVASCIASGPRFDGRRALTPGPLSPGARMVLEVFGQAYAASGRGYGEYTADLDGDDLEAGKLAARADRDAERQAAASGLPRAQLARELVTHWARAYLADVGDNNCLTTARHPLRLMGKRLPTYGTPWRKPKAPPPPAESAPRGRRAAPPDAGEVPPPPELLEAMRKLGKPLGIVHRDLKPANADGHTAT